jgi:hypothetical protein
MRIRTLIDISKLKRPGTSFRLYLDVKRVYINKAQLWTDEGLSLGWIHKAHPTFAFRDGMKEQLQAMMNKDFKDIKYALLPRTVKYKISDGMILMTKGIATQVTKTENTSSTSFRAAMAEKWQGLTAKTGGTLWGKTFIPFVREGEMGDAVMTAVFQQQNKYLLEATQRIVQNLADIYEIIDININDEEDEEMEGTGITLRHIFLQCLDKQGQPLLQSIEQTSTGGTYRFIFDKIKVIEEDAMLASIDSDLDKIGQWEECNTHYRYLPSNPITVIGSIPRSTPTTFCANNLSAFQAGPILGEISTANLQRPKPRRNVWAKVSYSDIARGAGSTGHTSPTMESKRAAITGKTQAAATVAESAENSLGSGPTSNQPEGAISGLSNLKRKMDKIYQERELFKAEHAKLEDEVSSVTNSLSNLGDEILATRQDMTKLSSTLREELAEFKNILLSNTRRWTLGVVYRTTAVTTCGEVTDLLCINKITQQLNT